MADPSTCPPLTPESIQSAHEKIKEYIHETPLITCKTIDAIASHPDPAAFLSSSPPAVAVTQTSSSSSNSNGTVNGTSNHAKPTPKFKLYFKAESLQKIGAFKARGAFHALTHLINHLGLQTVRSRGVTTHSSGNHAQALALAAQTFQIPSYIVMPTISTPSKIAGTQQYATEVIFSGSTSDEREAKVVEVINRTNAILVPPYDHPDIILGQGTAGLEMERQFQNLLGNQSARFDAVIAPLGGGGLLSGTATWFGRTSSSPPSGHANGHSSSSSSSSDEEKEKPKTLVFGAEPSFSGANDAQKGLSSHPPKRIPHVSSLTIADGLRTPVGLIPWSIVSDKSKVEGVFSVSEDEIKMALRLMMERTKLFLEPSAVVGVAVVLFCDGFREMVGRMQVEELNEKKRQRRQQQQPQQQSDENNGGEQQTRAWDVGIILSGGNTTVEALAKLFGDKAEEEREVGKIGLDGSTKVEDVAG